MSTDQFEPGGVPLDAVALSEELDFVQIIPTGLSATVFGRPLIYRKPGTDGSGGTGITELFIVPPDEDAFIMAPDEDAFIVMGDA